MLQVARVHPGPVEWQKPAEYGQSVRLYHTLMTPCTHNAILVAAKTRDVESTANAMSKFAP